jgi:hypothetical protein
VLDAARNDEQLALVELDVAGAQLDREVSFEDEEEVVRVPVLVPDELALDLDDANVVLVDPGDDLWCQCSAKRLSFSARLTFSVIPPP